MIHLLTRISQTRIEVRTFTVNISQSHQTKSNEPIRCSRRKAREKACNRVMIGSAVCSDWREKVREITFSQSHPVWQCKITFDTQFTRASHGYVQKGRVATGAC